MNERAIAFLDILGFEKLANSMDEKKLLDVISPFYFEEASNKEQKSLYENLNLPNLKSTEVTFFSDLIVISCEVKKISRLVMKVKLLMESFIDCGLFLRGGITYGRLFHEERVGNF